MEITYIALNNILEAHERENPSSPNRRQELGKVVYSEARRFSDDALLKKLALFELSPDRESLRELCRSALSAEEVARRISRDPMTPKVAVVEADWLWFGISILWERWMPDHPSHEMLDLRMQDGYLENDPATKAHTWLEAWDMFLNILNRTGLDSFKAFDRAGMRADKAF